MFANQKLLPRLPLPSLEESLRKYLAACRPLVPDAEFAHTERLVKAALQPDSQLHQLQTELCNREASQQEGSYVSAAWEAMYLEGRWPLPISSNPGAVTAASQVFSPDVTTQVQRAARLMAATTSVALEVESAILPPDVIRNVPLDMQQYTRMFNSSRMPRLGCDELVKSKTGGHVAVFRGDHIWKVAAVDAITGKPLSVVALEAALQEVIDNTPVTATTPSVAALTAGDRDNWAIAREKLAACNPNSLAAVDEALFHVALDLESVWDGGQDGLVGEDPVGSQLERAVRLSLVGHPSRAPRWFDQSLTLMVSADGVPMSQFEHSWGDGVAVLRLGNETSARVKQSAPPAPAEAAAHPPLLLDWDLPPDVIAARDRCAEELETASASLELSQLHFERWGVSQLKAWGVSPDGCVQAALQLAFFRSTGRTGATYESSSTAHFSAGRTETIRSCSGCSTAFVNAVVCGAPVAEQVALLRASAKRHSELAREAASGRGFDRHLFALKKLAEAESTFGSQPLFCDPTYLKLSGNELSTSTLTAPHCLLSGFGPVHPTGFGTH